METKKAIFDEYKYKIEMHCHTKPISSCGQLLPHEVAERYNKLGYDAIVLTNHFYKNEMYRKNKDEYIKFYLNGYRSFKEACYKYGIKTYFGIEIRFANVNVNDYLVYGITEDDVKIAANYLEGTIEEFYKGFKNEKNLIFQAHPFRSGMELKEPPCIDGYEVFNMHPGHNSAIGFAAKQAAKYKNLPIVGGSDFHEPGREGVISLCVKTLPESEKELVDILKKKDFVFRIGESIILP